MIHRPRDCWITGVGILSCYGDGVDAHISALFYCAPDAVPPVNAERFSPYTVHPLAPVDFSAEIPAKGDLRQMEAWQRAGVYAAGRALADAGLKDRPDLLEVCDLCIAAGNGERDIAADAKVLAGVGFAPNLDAYLNEALPRGIRPTLYLAQLSNLLAGNISIIHKATGSSRTFKGEEAAGLHAVEDAVSRIHAGTGDLFLVGGALNAERADLQLIYETGGMLWAEDWVPVWDRAEEGTPGGLVLGSMAAFLVLEAAEHATARGARAYGRIASVASDWVDRGEAHAVAASLMGMLETAPDGLAVLSGASGVTGPTQAEFNLLFQRQFQGAISALRGYGSRLGHGMEAHLPMGLALAAIAARAGRLPAPCGFAEAMAEPDQPFRAIGVTGVGHWRGEGLVVVEPVG